MGGKMRDKLKLKFKYFHEILTSIDIILALYINIAIIFPLYYITMRLFSVSYLVMVTYKLRNYLAFKII